VNNLVGDVVDMRSTFGRANAVHEGDLLELAITKTSNDLPPFMLVFNDPR
jgi:hypothetical protein